VVLGLDAVEGIAVQRQKQKIKTMSVLIDTHVLLWILSGSKRLKEVPWLRKHPYWTLSPVSLLEMQFLVEIGRLDLDLPEILQKLREDLRFKIDDVSLEELCLAALNISWTRDPFDRLLVAHSQLRSLPFGTRDQLIRKKYASVL